MTVNNSETTHKLINADSRNLSVIPDQSIDLIVTSPPYPMIQMWDDQFGLMNKEISTSLRELDGIHAFELMHQELDKVWDESYRVLKEGSFACINIGDATRTIGSVFRLYSNHSRIVSYLSKLGFDILPMILWRKQTNSPNKFMGSGMLPAGAYVTLEHEYIIIARKGGKKTFKTPDEKKRRMNSSFFWEERNLWFSDLWDFKGVSQILNIKNLRERSAAYPFELAYRLINMYSLYEDVVLDPFLGTGTTSFAGLSSGRNTIGIEIDAEFIPLIKNGISEYLSKANLRLLERIENHREFVKLRTEKKGDLKYSNIPHRFNVMTKQETKLILKKVVDIQPKTENSFITTYEEIGELSDGVSKERLEEEYDMASVKQTSLMF